jgi:hypothetical protein
LAALRRRKPENRRRGFGSEHRRGLRVEPGGDSTRGLPTLAAERGTCMPAHHRPSLTRGAALLFGVALTLVASASDAATSQATHARQATVRVSEGYYPVTGGLSPYFATSDPCPVRLARRGTTTALDALESARASGCVASYVVEETASGPYLQCVNGRCEATGYYWAIYRNGALTCQGVGDVVLAPGDELTVSFESYPTALALASCA